MSIPFRIVIAEDNAADVLLLKEVLRQINVRFSLEHYGNGEDAAKAIADMTNCPDLFLLDINIPRIDGLELLSLIRRREVTAHATVAMFTSSKTPADQREAERRGADDYIVKPTGYHEFVAGVGGAIRRLLERKTPGIMEAQWVGCFERRCSRRARPDFQYPASTRPGRSRSLAPRPRVRSAAPDVRPVR